CTVLYWRRSISSRSTTVTELATRSAFSSSRVAVTRVSGRTTAADCWPTCWFCCASAAPAANRNEAESRKARYGRDGIGTKRDIYGFPQSNDVKRVIAYGNPLLWGTPPEGNGDALAGRSPGL